MRKLLCDDCGADIREIQESYMVRNELWKWAVDLQGRGVLCVGCLEDRIGRRLDVHDFRALQINGDSHPKSHRLIDRLGDFAKRHGEAARRSQLDIRRGNSLILRRHQKAT